MIPNLQTISQQHVALLSWFEPYVGQALTWEQLKSAPAHVVNQAKGIYKPRSIPYALSIRETLNGPYGNQDLEFQSDGSWRYRYRQEEGSTGNSASLSTNQGLKACMQDGVPVVVLKQLSRKPDVTRYRVLGFADVVAWEDGVFTLQSTALTNQDPELATYWYEASPEFDPQDIEDRRKRTMREVAVRQGQPKFRSGLLTAYEGRCALTGCAVTEVLEAAHITPYLGSETNHITNGLLLRSDLHTLWDKGLIYLDDDYTLRLDPRLSNTEYASFEGKKLRLPALSAARPSVAAIRAHREWALQCIQV